MSSCPYGGTEAPNEQRPTASVSLLSARDIDPISTYEELLETDGLLWDAGLSAWLAPSYEGCKAVLSKDNADFRHHDSDPDEKLAAIHGNHRNIRFLTGDEHRRVHRWFLDVFSPAEVEKWREPLLRPIVANAIKGFSVRGRAELWTEFASYIPVRAMLAVLGLPWKDDKYVARITELVDTRTEYFNNRLSMTDELIDRAHAATVEIHEMMQPDIDARRSGNGDDVISRTWRDGPRLLDNWEESDVFSVLIIALTGGKDTTTIAISNALYMLLNDHELMGYLRTHVDRIPAFVEESLRLYPPPSYLVRVADKDVDVKGQRVVKDSKVVSVIAASGRDPRKWEDPHRVDLDRKGAHLTFNYGPRRCVGSALARAEVLEAVQGFLSAHPDMQWDPTGPSTEYPGTALRPHRPLHVTFTPREFADASAV